MIICGRVKMFQNNRTALAVCGFGEVLVNNEYKLNVAAFGTHNLIAQEIGSGQTVLDVGCNKGYFRSLLDKSNRIYGIDLDAGDLAVAEASGYCHVEKIDLNDCSKLELRERFDVIVFADVLEHLVNPVEVLKFFVDNYLSEGGKIIISLPNIAHITIRLQLLRGEFSYTDAGILDKTHLHFYTLKSAREFINAAGLEIASEKFSSNRLGRAIKIIPLLRTLLAFNFIFICGKLTSA